MRTGGDEFSNCMREGAEGRDVEDWVGVFPINDAAFGEDDGDKMDAGVTQERDGGGIC